MNTYLNRSTEPYLRNRRDDPGPAVSSLSFYLPDLAGGMRALRDPETPSTTKKTEATRVLQRRSRMGLLPATGAGGFRKSRVGCQQLAAKARFPHSFWG